jgi:hypothetical protein
MERCTSAISIENALSRSDLVVIGDLGPSEQFNDGLLIPFDAEHTLHGSRSPSRLYFDPSDDRINRMVIRVRSLTGARTRLPCRGVLLTSRDFLGRHHPVGSGFLPAIDDSTFALLDAAIDGGKGMRKTITMDQIRLGLRGR